MKNLDKHPKLKYFLKAVYYLIFRRKLYGAHKNYTFSDEKLKFTHILEAVNYIRVAGLPYNYYEFGCHSARTFSAAASAFKYLKMNQFELYAFDSFEGLPDTIKDKDGYFQGGTFSTSISDFLYLVKRQSGLILNPENCIKGYYEKPDLNLIWTYLHLPTVTLPMGIDKLNKLPVGVTLIGRKYTDKNLFRLIDTCFNNENKIL